MPKVSVVIPNYNHSIYLRQRIDSVLKQSYQDFEIILLDDDSTDESRTIFESYRTSPKVSAIIYNDINSGSTFKQWKKGIDASKGELIWIAESDDWCENTLLEELVSAFDRDANCVISYCQSYCILNSNIISWTSQHPFLSESIVGHEFIKRYMIKNNTIFNASMVLWKTEVYSKISTEFLNFQYCGDWLFWIEIAQLGNVHVSGKVLNYFRKHGKDVTSRAEKTGLSLLEPMRMLNIIRKQNVIDDVSYNIAYKHYFMNYWVNNKNIDHQHLAAIHTLYKNPLSGKTQYYKNLLSAFNRFNLKRKA